MVVIFSNWSRFEPATTAGSSLQHSALGYLGSTSFLFILISVTVLAHFSLLFSQTDEKGSLVRTECRKPFGRP